MESNCYCGKKENFIDCCGAIHIGKAKANTAEELMRSRYAAFVTANVDYILSTYANATRPIGERQNILSWTKSIEWLGLEVVHTKKGNINDLTGYVEFKATYLEDGIRKALHEKSFFQKEKGNWVYVSGEHPDNNSIKKSLSRNDLCYCGSGKKFKKCCYGKA